MADHQARTPEASLAPFGIGAWVIVKDRLMVPAQPPGHLHKRLVTVSPCRPWALTSDGLALEVGDDVATELIAAQRPQSPMEAPVLQVGHKSRPRRRPRAGHPTYRAINECGSAVEPALQPMLTHARNTVRDCRLAAYRRCSIRSCSGQERASQVETPATRSCRVPSQFGDQPTVSRRSGSSETGSSYAGGITTRPEIAQGLSTDGPGGRRQGIQGPAPRTGGSLLAAGPEAAGP